MRMLLCFNPYRVFKLAATYAEKQHNDRSLHVSIPIGFSSSLQLFSAGICRRRQYKVSIPIGFSSSLQHHDKQMLRPPPFQVSIPIGFSSSLQQVIYIPEEENKKVSIPIGFSSSLQLRMLSLTSSCTLVFQSLSGFQARCNYSSP